MNVLLVTQTYGPANGPGAFTEALAGGLAARGDRVTVLTPAPSLCSRMRERGGVAIVEIRACSLAPLYPEARIAFAPGRCVACAIDALQPDAVHVQDHFPLGRSAAHACAVRGVPLVATNHFVPENILPHVPLIARSRGAYRFLERALWRMVARAFAPAAVVTTPTETAAARLRPHLGGAALRVISCGVELARFAAPRADRIARRAALGLPAGDVVFAYVGRLDVEKRVDILVRAIAQLGRPGVDLLVVGRGREAGALTRLARALGIGDRVIFTGFVPPVRLPDLLACADYFAMAGDVELQSIATLEAMAAGLPVLAAAAGALPELVADGVNGALFRANDPADAAAGMAALIAAGDRWHVMSRASRTQAASHDLRFTVDAYRTLYSELAGR